MTTYHTFDIDNLPVPSDFELKAADKRRRKVPDLKVKITERGWGGHHICAARCRFRRNTLVEFGQIKIVVSTVGLLWIDSLERFDTVASDAYFETMAFEWNGTDTRWYDGDTSKMVDFDTVGRINEVDADDKANEMHDAIVREIADRIIKPDWLHDAIIEMEDAADEAATQADALSVLF